MVLMRLFFCGVFIWGALTGVALFAASGWKADDVTGVWWSPKKDSKIEIFARRGAYFGKIVWLVQEKAGKKDEKNPDPALREQTLMGLEILRDFKFDEKETWDGGRVYDPKSGKTYHSYLKLQDMDHLRLKGYLGLKAFGRTETFERVK